MSKLLFLGKVRTGSGTGYARLLRKKGEIPAIIYGFGQLHKICLCYKNFIQEYERGNLLSKVARIKINQEIFQAVAKEIQTDPVTDHPIHVDFKLVKDHLPIKISVLVRAVNKDKSPGIKKGGILNIVKKYISLNSLPKNVPTSLEVDISGLDIGANIYLDDIKLPLNVSRTSQKNQTVLTIAGRVEEQEEDQSVNNEDSSEKKEEKTRDGS